MFKSRSIGLDYSGHYLATNEDGELTVLALPSINEEIEVYLADDQLRMDQRFYRSAQVFLTLYDTIERSAFQGQVNAAQFSRL